MIQVMQKFMSVKWRPAKFDVKRNVRTASGSKTWPPAMCRVNQTGWRVAKSKTGEPETNAVAAYDCQVRIVVE